MKTLSLVLAFWKYGLHSCIAYRGSFLMQAGFMIFNNSFILFVYYLLFHKFWEVGGLSFETFFPLYLLAVIIYWIVHIFGYGYGDIGSDIMTGRLDAMIVTPKNILLKMVTSKMSFSAIGDLLSAPIFCLILAPHLLIDAGFLVKLLIVSIIGSITFIGVMIVYESLAFWIGSSEKFADWAFQGIYWSGGYPPGIFEGGFKIVLFTIFPSFFVFFYPHDFVMSDWSLEPLLYSIVGAVIFLTLWVTTFYRGLRRYESGNAMVTNV